MNAKVSKERAGYYKGSWKLPLYYLEHVLRQKPWSRRLLAVSELQP